MPADDVDEFLTRLAYGEPVAEAADDVMSPLLPANRDIDRRTIADFDRVFGD